MCPCIAGRIHAMHNERDRGRRRDEGGDDARILYRHYFPAPAKKGLISISYWIAAFSLMMQNYAFKYLEST